MKKSQIVQVYKKAEQEGGFGNIKPLEEKIIYAANMLSEGNPPKKVFGKDLGSLARNIALNLQDGDFKLERRDAAGEGPLAFDDSDLIALEHAIRFRLRGNGGKKQ